MAARVMTCHLWSVSAGALQVSPTRRVVSWNAGEHEPGRPVEPKIAVGRLLYCWLAPPRRAFRERRRGDSSCLIYYMTLCRLVKKKPLKGDIFPEIPDHRGSVSSSAG